MTFSLIQKSTYFLQTLGRSTMITAANGARVSAMKIFSITLRYFRDHAIQELRDATGTKIGHVSGAWRRVAARGNVDCVAGGHPVGGHRARHLEAGGQAVHARGGVSGHSNVEKR